MRDKRLRKANRKYRAMDERTATAHRKPNLKHSTAGVSGGAKGAGFTDLAPAPNQQQERTN
jgi:hypothetical protein